MKDHSLRWALIATIVALLACNQVKKQADCSALISKANTALQEIQAQSNSSTGKPEELRKLADTCERHATALEATEISDAELKGHRDNYVIMWRDIAKHSRAIADAGDKQDLPAMEAAQKQLEAVTAREDALVDAMNTSCSRQ